MQRSAEQLERAIAALQAQRGLLGDEVAETALGPLREQLAALQSAAPPPVQQQRLVSVLFLDVVGSTALSRQLDPEDFQAVMDVALAAFTRRVEQQGGRVMQYAGDSLLAAFGSEEVHEDDAERAVLAGLDLLRQAEAEALRVHRQFGHRNFGVRVGISSGPVLIGGGVDGEHSMRGVTVNIAARMEQTAPPGALRISHDTWRLVRGLFDCEEQPPLMVKGRDTPMRTHLVRGVNASPSSAARRGVDGVRTPMIGRESELARLQAGYAQVAGGQGGLLMLVVAAEAGLGKSRLLHEFDAWLSALPPAGRPRAAHWSALSAERRRGQPYGVLRDWLLSRLPGAREADPVLLRASWLAWAEAQLGHRGSAAVLGHLLGLDFADEPEVHALRTDARGLRDRAFFHAVQLIRAASAGALVLTLDDAHWADEGSLAFVEHLRQTSAPMPVLLILLARPGLVERRAAWRQDPAVRWLTLGPLSTEVSGLLARSLLQHLPSAPEQLTRALTEGGEGNPFFIEELANMLIDQGVIDVQGGAWTLHADRLSALHWPATLDGVLQARLDALPHDRRRALQLAAVAGPVFWDRTLDVLDSVALASLADLVTRELIQLHETSRLQAAREYAFRQHSLHRVAYQGVLKRVKRAAHAALARWLDARPDHGALQDQIAEHYEQGGDSDLALDAWQRAAEAAGARFANHEALVHARRALALCAPDDLARRLQLHLICARALELLADRPQLEATLDELQALADLHGDPGWRSEVAVRRSGFHFHGGDAARALASAQQAAALAPAGDSERGARAHLATFAALSRLGRHAPARASALLALTLAREGGHETLEASALNEIGMLALGAGDLVAASEHWNAALAMHRRSGHLDNAGGTLSNLAFVAMSVGDYEAARLQFEASREQCERVGRWQNVGIVEINLGIVLLRLGQPQAALQRALRALQLLPATGDRWAEAAAHRVAGEAEQALGQFAQARTHYQASRERFDQLDLGHLALETMAAQVDEALARDDVAEALGHAEEMLRRQAAGAGLEGSDEPLRIPLAIWRALRQAGDARADGVLAVARQELMQRADRLVHAGQREQFLHAVPHHRQILAAL